MEVRITHVCVGEGAETEEGIIAVRWRNDATGEEGEADMDVMIDWMERLSGEAVVGHGENRSKVGVVRPANARAYLRTYADDISGNNLLALPRF